MLDMWVFNHRDVAIIVRHVNIQSQTCDKVTQGIIIRNVGILSQRCGKSHRVQLLDVIIIMYVYHALINTLTAHMIDVNLNTIFYTCVEHLPKQFT